MSAKRVLYFEANLDGSVGGSHYCLLDIVRNIDRSQVEPVCVFYDAHDLIDAFERVVETHVIPHPPGFVFHRDMPNLSAVLCKVPGVAKALHTFQRLLNATLSRSRECRQVEELLTALSPDIIHLNNAPTKDAWISVAAQRNIPIVSHIRGTWKPRARHKQLIRLCSRLIAISSFVREALETHTGALSNTIVLHDGIDVQAFLERTQEKPETLLVTYDIPHDAPVIGIVGNLQRWKGQDVFLEAIRRLRVAFPNVHGILVGGASKRSDDSAFEKELRQWIDTHGASDYIHMTGFTTDVLAHLKLMDVVVHTSLEPEPLGRVIIEAQLLGKPTIASDHGGPRELIVSGETGFLVRPGDAAMLEGTIAAVLNNPGQRMTISEQTREYALSAYEISNYCDKLIEIYNDL